MLATQTSSSTTPRTPLFTLDTLAQRTPRGARRALSRCDRVDIDARRRRRARRPHARRRGLPGAIADAAAPVGGIVVVRVGGQDVRSVERQPRHGPQPRQRRRRARPPEPVSVRDLVRPVRDRRQADADPRLRPRREPGLHPPRPRRDPRGLARRVPRARDVEARRRQDRSSCGSALDATARRGRGRHERRTQRRFTRHDLARPELSPRRDHRRGRRDRCARSRARCARAWPDCELALVDRDRRAADRALAARARRRDDVHVADLRDLDALPALVDSDRSRPGRSTGSSTAPAS